MLLSNRHLEFYKSALPQPLTSIQRLYISRLVEKYGADFQRMMMDIKLNPMQHSVATLEKLYFGCFDTLDVARAKENIKEIPSFQRYEEERRQADVNSLMLILALLCLLLPMLFTYSAASPELTVESSLYLSRAASIVMLAAYFVYLIFQLWTHRQLFEAEDEGGDENIEAEEAVIGFWSGFAWLAGMTVFTALLSEYVVDTIEDASDSWGLSVSFLSIILLPIVGNAAEHAGAIIFAFKNKLDISLGVALGSATQIAMFVVPLCVTVAWGMGVNMDLNFNLIETGSLAVAIIVTSFTLQKKLQAAIKDSVSENEAFQKVFGKEKHGYVRSMGLGVTPSQINRSTRSTSSSAESEQIKEMQEEINALKEKNSKIDELTQAIIFLTQRDKARTKENELLMQMQNFSGRQGLESPADGRRSSESSYRIGDNGTSGGTN
ncbi:unnamed protein product [Vicia faba]|uniref:Sodium/calcium exchanger membrane region domain-containing protein n=1 Tax=Vicia faba TaxID=3906 RepID=A0AAV0ZMF0_VICFA|nr:unnamed protein product [Vicia faba]